MISVQNLQFKQNKESAGDDAISKVLGLSEIYLTPFSEVFKYIFVIILLLIVYKKVMSPFAEKMLEISKDDEELERPDLSFSDDEDDDLVGKVQDMRKKVEEQLGIGGNLNEDELKHEVLLEKVKALAEETPEEIASVLESLLFEEFDDESMHKR